MYHTHTCTHARTQFLRLCGLYRKRKVLRTLTVISVSTNRHRELSTALSPMDSDAPHLSSQDLPLGARENQRGERGRNPHQVWATQRISVICVHV